MAVTVGDREGTGKGEERRGTGEGRRKEAGEARRKGKGEKREEIECRG